MSKEGGDRGGLYDSHFCPRHRPSLGTDQARRGAEQVRDTTRLRGRMPDSKAHYPWDVSHPNTGCVLGRKKLKGGNIEMTGILPERRGVEQTTFVP